MYLIMEIFALVWISTYDNMFQHLPIWHTRYEYEYRYLTKSGIEINKRVFQLSDFNLSIYFEYKTGCLLYLDLYPHSTAKLLNVGAWSLLFKSMSLVCENKWCPQCAACVNTDGESTHTGSRQAGNQR